MEITNRRSGIEQFREKLRENGIAHEYELVGCTDSELVALENQYGRLPDVYRNVMRLLGRRAGKLVKRGEFDFYIDQLTKLNEETLETIQEAWEEKGRVGNIFLICSRYGSDHTFILTGQAIDSPVFQWRETDEIKQINSSVWDWFNDWVEDAKAMISLKD